MTLQLALEAQGRWHRITAVERLRELIEGVRFADGIAQLAAQSRPTDGQCMEHQAGIVTSKNDSRSSRHTPPPS